MQEVFTLTLNQKDRKPGMSKSTMVAGSKVRSGQATNNAATLVRVSRSGDKLHEGRVVSLKSFKDEVRAVKSGKECGVILADFGAFEPADELTFFEMVPKKPGLYDALEPDEED